LIIWVVPDDPVHCRKDKCILTQHARAVNFFHGERHLTARAMIPGEKYGRTLEYRTPK
jgi:hypothetical protein